MFRRVVTTIVWFIAAWEVGAAIELGTGLEAWVAPALAGIAVFVAAVDPFKLLYAKRSSATAEQTATSSS